MLAREQGGAHSNPAPHTIRYRVISMFFPTGATNVDRRAFTAVAPEERHGHEDLFAFEPRHVAKMALP